MEIETVVLSENKIWENLVFYPLLYPLLQMSVFSYVLVFLSDCPHNHMLLSYLTVKFIWQPTWYPHANCEEKMELKKKKR